jgi:SHS2 domain-containing protein
MYETFEHTADLGLRVRAPDLDTLFAEAAACLFSVIVEDIGTVRPLQSIEVKIDGAEREYLLFDWLRELLYCFDSRHLLLCRFEVRIGDNGLMGTAWGEPFDPTQHALAHEVKAITYHGLKVERIAEEWLAEVIVDI